AGLRKVAIVVDEATAAPTRAVAGDGVAFGVRVAYVEQPVGAGAATALAGAFERVGGAPCVVHHGRAFLAGSLRPVVSDFAQRLAECVVLVGGRPADLRAGAPARGRLLSVCAGRPGGERLVPLGIDLCRPAVLERLESGAADGVSLSDALVDLATEGRAEAWAVKAQAVRLDSSDAVLEASRLALDELEADWAQ